MNAGVNTASKTPAAPPRPAPLVHKGPVHKGPREKVQGYRFPTRDYRQPAFYLITMSALDRRPRFATCAENRTTLTEDGQLVYDLWHRIAKDYPQIALSTLVIMPDRLHGIVSRFISPGEKDIARAALDAGGVVILMKPDGFPPCFKPHGKYFDLCVQGRLLILACRPPAAGNTPVTRDLCLAMNRWCQHVAKPLCPVDGEDEGRE